MGCEFVVLQKCQHRQRCGEGDCFNTTRIFLQFFSLQLFKSATHSKRKQRNRVFFSLKIWPKKEGFIFVYYYLLNEWEFECQQRISSQNLMWVEI